MVSYYVAAWLGVLLTALSQVLFKLGANRGQARGLLFTYLNSFSLAAYALLFAVTLLNVYAYRHLPLKLAVVILPSTYILVGLFSYYMLKERISRNQVIGAAIIVLGIFIFNLQWG